MNLPKYHEQTSGNNWKHEGYLHKIKIKDAGMIFRKERKCISYTLLSSILQGIIEILNYLVVILKKDEVNINDVLFNQLCAKYHFYV